MADDFDDLYNVYNGDGKDYEYNDEDLYGGDNFDLQEDVVKSEAKLEQTSEAGEEKRDNSNNEIPENQQEQQEQKRKPQQQQQQQHQQQQRQMGGNRYSPAAYQQYLAVLQQQMMMNQYMMQSQYYQNMPQQQQQQQQYKQPVSNTNNHKVETTKKPRETSDSDDDDRKLFVGGLNWETTEDKLRDYFSQFGQVVEISILRDPNTQRSRGFGFLTMKDASTVDKIVRQDNHVLDGKKIDPKRAISRDEQDKAAKIFVGGISTEVTEEEFRRFFGQFGTVIDATLMMERDTGRSRGFGFITFESSEGVEKVLEQPRLSIKDKHIDVKKAMPRGKHQQLQQQLRNSQLQNYMPNGFMGANMMYNMYPQMAYYNQQQQQGGYNNMYNNKHSSSSSSRHYNKGHDDARVDYKYKNEGSGGGKMHSSKNQQHYRPY